MIRSAIGRVGRAGFLVLAVDAPVEAHFTAQRELVGKLAIDRRGDRVLVFRARIARIHHDNVEARCQSRDFAHGEASGHGRAVGVSVWNAVVRMGPDVVKVEIDTQLRRRIAFDQ